MVLPGLTLGLGTDDGTLWCSFDDRPTLFNDITLQGALVNISMLCRLGLISEHVISMAIEEFEAIPGFDVGSMSGSIILAEEVTYKDPVKVKGDVLRLWSTEPDSVSSPSNIENKPAIMDFGYSIFLLEEESDRPGFWVILYPSAFAGLDLSPVVTLHDVIPLNMDDSPMLADLPVLISLDRVVRVGLLASPETDTEDYSVGSVSMLGSLIESGGLAPVSVDCYTL